eukprot:1921770-Amphidinium_carterae.1
MEHSGRAASAVDSTSRPDVHNRSLVLAGLVLSGVVFPAGWPAAACRSFPVGVWGGQAQGPSSPQTYHPYLPSSRQGHLALGPRESRQERLCLVSCRCECLIVSCRLPSHAAYNSRHHCVCLCQLKIHAAAIRGQTSTSDMALSQEFWLQRRRREAQGTTTGAAGRAAATVHQSGPRAPVATSFTTPTSVVRPPAINAAWPGPPGCDCCIPNTHLPNYSHVFSMRISVILFRMCVFLRCTVQPGHSWVGSSSGHGRH